MDKIKELMQKNGIKSLKRTDATNAELEEQLADLIDLVGVLTEVICSD